MNKTRLEWKVGLFVLVSLLVLAGIVLRFSKGASFFGKTYDILMKAENVGGIIPGAVVLMAGVPVGNVMTADLEEGGKSVLIHLRIQKKYSIHGDAVFSINQLGFLGDRYVSILPTANAKPALKNGEMVLSEPSFDLQEAARSAGGLLRRVDDTAKKLNEAVARIDRSLFAENTLSNLTATVANFFSLSDRALTTMDDINQFVRTNSHPLSASVSNLVVFSDQLNQVSRELQETVSTNRQEITTTIKNIESASLRVDKLAADLQEGKGLAGSLLKDEELQQNVFNTMSNLSLLSSNLNRFGLFWKPKVKASAPAAPLKSPGRRPGQ
jgi:phospholipid/cholesterol/gamma-HCH transport system substrate-binding protein